MQKNKESILAVVLFVGLVSHFGIGYFFWDTIKFVNIYYLSIYFLCDVFGFIIYLIATYKILKGVGALTMVLSLYYIFMEFNNPSFWVERDYLTLGLCLTNCLFIWFFTDKVKSRKV